VNGPAGPFNFIRKMACNFGWDWGPALPTSGIWRGVRLEGWSRSRITSVRSSYRADDRILDVHVGLEWSGIKAQWDEIWQVGTTIREEVGSRRTGAWLSDFPEGCTEVKFSAEFDQPIFWWPISHGAPFLYLIDVEINNVEGTGLDGDRWSSRIGLRTVELDTSPDEIGRKFVLKVNGKLIFCKGFNWIPDDCFLDRATDPQRVRERIQQAVDAGANMLRVWGGGIYETDDFYDVCDELGVLVWQDFPFACATYSEEEPFKSEVEAEARYNVARLAHHPSLALWNGCNENLWGYRDWGWKDSSEVKGPDGTQRSWGLGYYLDLLPSIVKELDPSRPYWAASPWSGDPDPDNGVHPNADTHGNMHVWKPWFREDYTSYREFMPRFCSEFGFQGPATYASIARVVPPEARDFGSPQMRHRQKSGDTVRDDGDRRNLRHMLRHFNLPGAQELLDALASPDPDRKVPYCGAEPLHAARTLPSTVNFDDLHYLLQLNQARALTLGVEWFRSRQPRCMGTLYWQLNDCWPGVTSWSCVDGDGRSKPLWYATRRFFLPRILTIQPADPATHNVGAHLTLFAINDSDEPWLCETLARHVDFVTGEKNGYRFRGTTTVPPRSIEQFRLFGEPVGTTRDPSRELLVCDVGNARAMWFFAPDKELNYPRSDFEAAWNDGKLTIRAKSLLRDVCVFVDRLDPDATISDQLVTLMPGESFTFTIDSTQPLTKEQLTSPPVFQCANRFGKTLL
jgi:beta-mannosidase